MEVLQHVEKKTSLKELNVSKHSEYKVISTLHLKILFLTNVARKGGQIKKNRYRMTMGGSCAQICTNSGKNVGYIEM